MVEPLADGVSSFTLGAPSGQIRMTRIVQLSSKRTSFLTAHRVAHKGWENRN